MNPFPHRYEVRLRRSDGARGVLTSDARPALEGAPPPEFDGPAGVWSPEHLLLASASLCLMTTFLAVASKSKLTVAGYESRAEGVLDKTPEGLGFTLIVLHVALAVAEADRERAARLLETAKRHCIVSNSLKHPVELETQIKAAHGG